MDLGAHEVRSPGLAGLPSGSLIGLTLERAHKMAVALGRRLAFVGVLGLLLIAILTILDILLRSLAMGFVPGANEILALGVAIAVAATFPAGAAEVANLSVDMLSERLSARAKDWLHLLGTALLLLVYCSIATSLFVSTRVLAARAAVTEYLRWSEAPFIAVVAALLGLSALVQVVMVLQSLRHNLAANAAPPRPSGPSAHQNASVGARYAVAILAVALIAAGFAFGNLGAGLSSIARGAPATTAVVGAALMMGLILFTVPIAAAMGTVGLVGASLLMGFSPAMTVLGTTVVQYLTDQSLAVLPFFLVMGALCSVAGLSSDIYRLAHVLVGHRKGGLALATIGGCAGFGAISSSSIATCAAIGQVVLPEMQRRGYSPALATGTVAAGGTLGPLLSPGSGPLVVYALLTEQSIGQLFIGSAIPAALALILFGLTVVLYTRLQPDSAPLPERRAGWDDIRRACIQSWGVILLFLAVFGGIYGGVFTITEAAAVGAGLAFIFAMIRGKLSAGAIWAVMRDVTATTAMLYMMFFGALMFSFFIDYSNLPESLTEALKNLPIPPFAVIILLLTVFVLLGCVMESFAVMLITVPIVTPYIQEMGYSMIWWGVVMVGVVETGMITPPLGLNVLVLKNVARDVPTRTVFKGVLPFIGADLIRLVLLLAFPALVTWLPEALH
jgi:C4-dicarboxylate transporter DctM subunit